MPITPTLISSRSLPPSAPSASHRISPLPPQALNPILAIAQVPSFLRTSGPQPSQPHPQSRARRPLSEAADGRFMLSAIYLNLRAYPGTPRLLHSRQAWQAGPYPHACMQACAHASLLTVRLHYSSYRGMWRLALRDCWRGEGRRWKLWIKPNNPSLRERNPKKPSF